MSDNIYVGNDKQSTAFRELLEEACRQWCDYVDEAPERKTGEGFADFFYDILNNDEIYKDVLSASPTERTNVGYVITDSVHIGEYEYVLGVNKKEPDRFVTWLYFNNAYYFGNYFNDLSNAQKDLSRRVHEKAKEMEHLDNNLSGKHHKPHEREDR